MMWTIAKVFISVGAIFSVGKQSWDIYNSNSQELDLPSKIVPKLDSLPLSALEISSQYSALQGPKYVNLVDAIRENDIRAVERITSIVSRDGLNLPANKWTPLGLSIGTSQAGDRLRILKHFLEKGADPNTLCSPDNDPPLFRAIGFKNLEAVDLLLKYGASVNNAHPHNTFFQYPLEYAVEKNAPDIVSFLLANGVDPTLQSKVIMH